MQEFWDFAKKGLETFDFNELARDQDVLKTKDIELEFSQCHNLSYSTITILELQKMLHMIDEHIYMKLSLKYMDLSQYSTINSKKCKFIMCRPTIILKTDFIEKFPLIEKLYEEGVNSGIISIWDIIKHQPKSDKIMDTACMIHNLTPINVSDIVYGLKSFSSNSSQYQELAYPALKRKLQIYKYINIKVNITEIYDLYVAFKPPHTNLNLLKEQEKNLLLESFRVWIEHVMGSFEANIHINTIKIIANHPELSDGETLFHNLRFLSNKRSCVSCNITESNSKIIYHDDPNKFDPEYPHILTGNYCMFCIKMLKSFDSLKKKAVIMGSS